MAHIDGIWRVVLAGIVCLTFSCEGARVRQAGGGCATNRDCGGGEECIAGDCVAMSGRGCGVDDECDPGQYCDLGVCRALELTGRCASDFGCEGGQHCDSITGVCVQGDRLCTSDTECAAVGQHCNTAAGMCVDCTDTTECPGGFSCLQNRCIDASATASCVSDGECNPPASICELGACVPGCNIPNTSNVCLAGAICDPGNGRCKTQTAGCSADSHCTTPGTICESGQCIDGCAISGGLQCTGGNTCDVASSRCISSSSCTTDVDCGAPAGVCDNTVCLPGCGQLGGAQCSAGTVCDTARSGRCVNITGPCSQDTDCGSPSGVCEGGQCVPGCGQAGGVQCSGMMNACNPGTGRCQAGNGPFCSNDGDCNAPQEVCNRLSGLCETGCAVNGCSAPATCQPTGHCSSAVCNVDSFEDNDTVATASPVSAGSFAALSACPGDDDFYRFDLQTGEEVRVEALFPHADGNIDLRLLGAGGTQVAASQTQTDNESLTYVASSNGTYTLELKLAQDLGADPGNNYGLTLTISCGTDAFEPNDALGSGAPITAGTHNNLTMCPQNDDYYEINLTQGEQITVDVQFIDDEGDIDIRLHEPGLLGLSVASSGSTSDNESFTYVAETTGTYSIRVWLFSDAGTNPGNRYSMTITTGNAPPPPMCSDDALEPNNTEAAAALVTPGVRTGLQVCPMDEDFYGIDLAIGDELTFDVSFDDSEGDLDLQLRNPSGTIVASSGSSSDNESVTHTAQVAGRHTARVWLYGEAGSSPGNSYSIDVAIAGTPPVGGCAEDTYEQNDTQAAASAVSAGNINGLRSCTADDDFFSLTLGAGDQITVDASFSDAEGDIDIQLLNAAGAVVASAGTASDNESMSYTAAAAGTYTVRVFLYGDSGVAEGNDYSLAISVVPVNPTCNLDAMESNNTPATAYQITSGSFPALTSCPADDDYYNIPLNQGQTITVSVMFSHAEGDLDVGLFDSTGVALVTSVTEDDNEQLSYPITSSGMYTILVVLYADSGSVPGNGYEMSVTY